MIRILFCTPLCSIGGISRWASHIIEYGESVKQDGIQVVPFQMNRLRSVGTKTSRWNRLISGIIDYWRIYLKYIDILKSENQYDIVHLSSSASISLLKDILFLRTAQKKNIKTIIHFHFGRIPDVFLKKNWEYRLLKKTLRFSNSIIVIDQASYNTLKGAGYSNVYYVPNPIAPKVLSYINSFEANISRNHCELLFAGHVIRTKGVYELIEACKSMSGIQLKMMGAVHPEVKKQLLDLASKEGDNSWLQIVGEHSYEEVLKEMMQCAVFVLPTYTEGFPNVILESMACGCSIVTTDVGAIPEMLDIKNGFNNGICIKPRDVNQLHDAIYMMLNSSEYAQQCGRNAQLRVNALYTMPRIWTLLVEIWMSLGKTN